MDFKKSIQFIIGLLLGIPMMAQDNYHQGPTFHSPEAASLGKYGDIPVSHHTGTANISIPIYTLSDGPLSIPISLSYHSSGIRVDEMASQVGLGWSLNAGGMITRSVNGAPDEGRRRDQGRSNRNGWGWYKDGGIPPEITDPSSNCGSPNINCDGFDDGIACDCRDYSYDAGRGLADTEPDIYSISMPGFSGKFLFNEAGEALTIPKSDIKIEPLLETFDNYLGPNNGRFRRWTVTLPEGTKYFFGESGATENIYNGLDTNDEDYSTSTWYLYRIESVTGDHHINLTYDDISYRYGSRLGQTSQRGFDDSALIFFTPGTFNAAPAYLQWTTVLGKEISNISTSTGAVSVDFERNSAFRRDLVPKLGSTNKMYPLKNIRVTSATGALCKLFELQTSHFISPDVAGLDFDDPQDSDRYRLRLDRVIEKSCSGTIVNPPHEFSYHTSIDLGRRYSLGRDHWGYYNGHNTQESLLPNGIVSTIDLNTFNGGANREPHAINMKAWILSDITYPTGGRVHFDYEPHVDPGDGVTIIGGLRIRTVQRFDSGSITPAYQSTYNYLAGTYFPGLISSVGKGYVYKINPIQGAGENGYEPCWGDEMFSSTRIAPMSTSQGSHITYSQVEVVDEHEGATLYEYYNFVPHNTISNFYHPFVPVAQVIGSGELHASTDYDDSNTPVSENTTIFDLDDDREYITALKMNVYEWRCGGGTSGATDHSLKHTYTIDISRLRRTMEISTTDGVSITTNNTFGPDHDFPIEVYGTRSDGSAFRNTFTYPHDYSSTIYLAMRNYYNQVGNLVTSTSYKTPIGGNEIKTSEVTHSYEFINGVPLIDGTSVEPTGSEAVSYFFDYDPYDRITESQMEYDNPTCFLYDGYNQPVAKIINHSYQEIITLLGSDRSLLENSLNNTQIRYILQTLKSVLPDEVLMETFLHEPGVGIIEQTNTNGITTHYEYDELGRLLEIRDQNNYILKEFDYHFAE